MILPLLLLNAAALVFTLLSLLSAAAVAAVSDPSDEVGDSPPPWDDGSSSQGGGESPAADAAAWLFPNVNWFLPEVLSDSSASVPTAVTSSVAADIAYRQRSDERFGIRKSLRSDLGPLENGPGNAIASATGTGTISNAASASGSGAVDSTSGARGRDPSSKASTKLFYAQHSQDQVLAPLLLNLTRNSPSDSPGFFIESGARDGVEHSNTLFLESHHNWGGILVEPTRAVFFNELRRNRRTRAGLFFGGLSPSGQSEVFRFSESASAKGGTEGFSESASAKGGTERLARRESSQAAAAAAGALAGTGSVDSKSGAVPDSGRSASGPGGGPNLLNPYPVIRDKGFVQLEKPNDYLIPAVPINTLVKALQDAQRRARKGENVNGGNGAGAGPAGVEANQNMYYVDFWSLDIEGLEAEVLWQAEISPLAHDSTTSLGLPRIKVGVLLVEMNKDAKKNEKIEKTLRFWRYRSLGWFRKTHRHEDTALERLVYHEWSPLAWVLPPRFPLLDQVFVSTDYFKMRGAWLPLTGETIPGLELDPPAAKPPRGLKARWKSVKEAFSDCVVAPLWITSQDGWAVLILVSFYGLMFGPRRMRRWIADGPTGNRNSNRVEC